MLKTAILLGLFAIVAGISLMILTGPRNSTADLPDSASAPPAEPPQPLSYEIVHEYPHDPDAVTQGLVYHGGFLYESSGLRGQASARKVRLETGEVVQQRAVDRRYFAEGLTEWHGRLIQLTPIRSGLGPGSRIWQKEDPWTAIKHLFGGDLGVTYDLPSLTPQSTFTYRYEGWGLTHDDRRLILSDGTSYFRFLNPETFQQLGRIHVTDQGTGTRNWNELEFINGEIYANIFHQDRIAIINPETGQIRASINLHELRKRLTPPPQDAENPGGSAMLNGIAYDAAGDRLFVTGKHWPQLFEIRLQRSKTSGR